MYLSKWNESIGRVQQDWQCSGAGGRGEEDDARDEQQQIGELIGNRRKS